MQRLPAAVVVDAGPGSDGPTIVQLPVKRAHRAGPLPSQVLGADLDNFRLLYLTQIDERGEVFRLPVLAQHISKDTFVSALVFLMRLHHRGANVEVTRLVSEGMNGAHLGKGL